MHPTDHRRCSCLLSITLILSSSLSFAQPVPTTTSTQSHQQASSSKHYEVDLKGLGSTWRTLDQEQAKKLSPIALAGAVYQQELIGLVLSEPVRRGTLNDYANTLLEHTQLEALIIEDVEQFTYLGHSALKIVYSGDEAGGRFRYLNVVFMIDGQGYQVISGGNITRANVEALSYFYQSVKLTVSVQPKHLTPVADDQLRGRRIIKGTFEDALSGLRLNPQGTWQLISSAHTHHLNDEAITGLVHQDQHMYLLFFDRACPTQEREACRAWVSADRYQDLQLKQSGGTLEFSLFGEPRPFQRLTHQDENFSYLYHVHIRSGRALEILAWTTSPTPTEGALGTVWTQFPAALAAISELSSIERQSLFMQTYQAPPMMPVDEVTTHDAWLRERYHHFDAELSWKAPPGLWKVTREKASTLGPRDELFTIAAPRYGLTSQLKIEVKRSASPEQSHQATWQALTTQLRALRGTCDTPEQGSRYINGRPSKWTRCTLTQKTDTLTRSWVYQLDTLRSSGSIVQLLSWAPASLFHGVAKVPREALEEQLSWKTSGGIDIKIGEGWTDQRFRYRVKLSKTQGSLNIRPNLGLGVTSSVVEYHHPSFTLISFAVSRANQDTVDQILNHLAQPSQSTSKSQTAVPPTIKKVWQRGQPAQRISWPPESSFHRGALLINRSSIIYGLVVVGKEENVKQLLNEEILIPLD